MENGCVLLHSLLVEKFGYCFLVLHHYLGKLTIPKELQLPTLHNQLPEKLWFYVSFGAIKWSCGENKPDAETVIQSLLQ